MEIYDQMVNRKVYSKWSLTYTIKPFYCDKLTHVEQYRIFIADFAERVSKLGHVVLSTELTKRYNLHFHCLITSDTMTIQAMRGLVNYAFLDSSFGHYWLRPCYDQAGWIDYMNKQPYFVENYSYAF